MTRRPLGIGLLAAAGLLALGLVSAPAVLADGGPHRVDLNSGTAGLSGDCAACHRAHTAQATDLLKAALPGLCLTCHDGTGATTDVVNGWQYVPDGSGVPTSTLLGALRGGGFSYALIDSGQPARLISNGRFLGHVGVLPQAAREPVTSSHLGAGTVWGNGADGTAGAGAGPVTLTCTSCHNPHGNGRYRILQTSPGEDWTPATAGGWVAPLSDVEVRDVGNPAGAVLNYTVLPGTLASAVIGTYQATQGDYWRWRAPWNLNTGVRDPLQVGWNGTAPTNAAANSGVPVQNATGLMTAWCVACHTRYSGLPDADGAPSGLVPQADATFTYRHPTDFVGCQQCHVSHGSNALVTTSSALWLANPDGTLPSPIPSAGPAGATVTSGDSRLLKIDERGTCQLCHDPTTDSPANGYVGPAPTPGAP